MKIVTRRNKRWLRRSMSGVLRQETPISQQRNGTFIDVGQKGPASQVQAKRGVLDARSSITVATAIST
jgi:hypothetical protein